MDAGVNLVGAFKEFLHDQAKIDKQLNDLFTSYKLTSRLHDLEGSQQLVWSCNRATKLTDEEEKQISRKISKIVGISADEDSGAHRWVLPHFSIELNFWFYVEDVVAVVWWAK